MTRKEKAMKNFKSGYNCAQSLTLAFSDMVAVDEKTLAMLSSSFGGGIGRLREVCGAVSGMAMILGLVYGYDGPETGEPKSEHYKRIQTVAKEFEKKNGSMICRELLGLSVKHDDPNAAARTKEYYASRPCEELVGSAAEILEQYIKKNNGKSEFHSDSLRLQ